jgi:PAS domain S-box-containing protein
MHMRSLLQEPKSADVAVKALAELNTTLTELEAVNDELNRNNEVLATVTRAHELEAARYKALFERIPVPYVVTDDWGVISEANAAAEELLGVPRDMLRGKPISVFVPPAERRAFRDRINTLPLTSVWEVNFQPRGRERILVQIDVTSIPGERPGSAKLGWVLQNMTPQRAAASAERMLAREAVLRMEAQAGVTRLRALHVGLETLACSSTQSRAERVLGLLEELVPRFARAMVCELPDESTIEVGEVLPTDHSLQTMIARTHGGRLIARRSTPFTGDDGAILLAAANAIALLYYPTPFH